ncbi:MAG: hypothetical protein HQK51_01850 [Oligoflexia bacterium]|nr:hypothetical protein [Oligoflexia bacterium]
MAVSIVEFKKVLKSLERAIAIPNGDDDIARDATIQGFEVCRKLAWKTSRS